MAIGLKVAKIAEVCASDDKYSRSIHRFYIVTYHA
jgi:hypothetical protein